MSTSPDPLHAPVQTIEIDAATPVAQTVPQISTRVDFVGWALLARSPDQRQLLISFPGAALPGAYIDLAENAEEVGIAAHRPVTTAASPVAEVVVRLSEPLSSRRLVHINGRMGQ
jgi:hypothetical protein